MNNTAIIKITDCLACPYIDCQCEDSDGYSSVYCGYMNEFLGECKTRWIINGASNIPVPDNCPLLNKDDNDD